MFHCKCINKITILTSFVFLLFFFFLQIMSPTAQEKLCSALTGIDLCDGVQRLSKHYMLSILIFL